MRHWKNQSWMREQRLGKWSTLLVYTKRTERSGEVEGGESFEESFEAPSAFGCLLVTTRSWSSKLVYVVATKRFTTRTSRPSLPGSPRAAPSRRSSTRSQKSPRCTESPRRRIRRCRDRQVTAAA